MAIDISPDVTLGKYKSNMVFAGNGGYTIYRVRFDNGMGASVIHEGEGELWELAVLKFTEDDRFTLVYDTPVTKNGDVLRWLTATEVQKAIAEVEAL